MKKEVYAWSMYDLANTAFSSLFVTFFFPLLVKEFLGGSELHIGFVFSISMFLVGLSVPLIGSYTDKMGKRIPTLFWFTVLCCLSTFMIFWSNLFWVLVLGVVANFTYHAALTAYNAILPSLGKSSEFGTISGIGVSFGYVGTLLSLICAVLVMIFVGWESLLSIRLMFPLTALFFFLFALPTFFIREQSAKQAIRPFASVLTTVRTIFRNKPLLFYLLSVFMYINAITAIIVFMFLYGRSEIGLSLSSFMVVYTIFSLSAVVGSYWCGRLTDRIGAKLVLILAGISWVIVILVMNFMSSVVVFTIAGALGGISLGAVWTSTRPLLISISPKKSIGEYFGFSELSSKFSGIFGPVLFGWLASVYNYHAALLSLIGFFVLGLVCLFFVKK